MAKRDSPWKEFEFREVFINWKNPAHDWHYFYVEYVKGTSARLTGRADRDTGSPHDGTQVIAKWDEVSEIWPVPTPPDDSYSNLENGVLDKAKALVDGRDKQDHYGPPEEFMGRLAKMWGGYLGLELKPTDAALMMAILKAARLRTNPEHEDSLVDFVGYGHIYNRIRGK